MSDLLSGLRAGQREALGLQACVLYGFALPDVDALLHEIQRIGQAAPFRQMTTPGGYSMSVQSSNCGSLGWVTDMKGYRYTGIDPLTDQRWPAMPEVFSRLAGQAAQAAGFDGFQPDACLLNCYAPGAKMSLHQDKNERDMSQPIVSVSLGMTAVFQFGGMTRSAPVHKLRLEHGDIVVWGGRDRLRFHGVAPLGNEGHPVLGCQRINLTFRKAG